MRNLLLSIFAVVCLNSNAGVVIDSLSKDTVCLHTFLRVYCHTTGTVNPSQQLALDFNGTIVINGTYQQLIDSNYVWGFIVPVSCPGYETGVNLFIGGGQTINYPWLSCCTEDVGINEIQYNDKIISVKYTSLIGEALDEVPVNQIVIRETKYFSGIKREKIFITQP